MGLGTQHCHGPISGAFFFFFFNQGVIGRTWGECVEPQEKIAWYSAFNFYQRTWTHILRSSLDDN